MGGPVRGLAHPSQAPWVFSGHRDWDEFQLRFRWNLSPTGAVTHWMEAMMRRSLLCFGFLVILESSAFSQPAKTAAPAFYVVLNSLTKSCTVVDKLPRTDTPNITVASDAIYSTRAEAETAIKSLKPCSR
jgi:hypothetical protein